MPGVRWMIAGVALLYLAGCQSESRLSVYGSLAQSGDPAVGAPANNGELPQNNGQIEDPDGPGAEAVYRLVLEQAPEALVFGARGSLAVQYLDEQGAPISGSLVRFVAQGPELMLDAASGVTDEVGVAEIQVVALQQSGLASVRVEAPRAKALDIPVQVNAPEGASYTVTVEDHSGRALDQAQVMLLDPSLDCAALDPGQLLPTTELLQAEQNPGQVLQTAVFSPLPNGASYTVLAVGELSPGVVAAWGCDDSRPVIANGAAQVISLEMVPVPPTLQGPWTVTTQLDLTDALPPGWASNVEFVANVFANPLGAVTSVLLGDPQDNNDGLLGSFLGDSPGTRALIEGILADVLSLTPYGQQLDRFFGLGGDGFRLLHELTLRGDMDFAGAPALDGLLPTPTAHRYDTLLIRWESDCVQGQACEAIEQPLSQISGVGVLQGNFQGQVWAAPGASFLEVERHGFAFNYGALLVFLLEEYLLPRVFGVRSVGAALELLISCDAVAQQLFPDFGDFLLREGAALACREGLDILGSQVLERALGAALGIPQLTLGTWEGGPEPGCALAELSPYGPEHNRVRGLSLGSQAEACGWDARFEAPGEAPGQIESTWMGSWRQGAGQ